MLPRKGVIICQLCRWKAFNLRTGSFEIHWQELNTEKRQRNSEVEAATINQWVKTEFQLKRETRSAWHDSDGISAAEMYVMSIHWDDG